MTLFLKRWGGAGLYVLIFLLVEAVLFVGLYENRVKNEDRQYFSLLINEFDVDYRAVVRSYGFLAESVFEESVNKPDVTKVLKEAYSAMPERRKALRSKIAETINPTFNNLMSKGLNYVTFYFPDNSVFLRMHNPTLFGDVPDDVMCPVKQANAMRSRKSGFEICSVYSGYKYVFPIFHEGRHVGSFEAGLPVMSLTEDIEQFFPVEVDFIVKRSVIEGDILKEGWGGYEASDISPDYMKKVGDRDVYRSAAQADEIDSVNEALRGKLSGRLEDGGPFAVAARSEGEHYIAVFLPVSGAEGEQEAYLVAYKKDDEVLKHLRNFIVFFILSSSVALLLMLLFWKAGRRSKLLEAAVAERTSHLRAANDELENEIAERKLAEEKLRLYYHSAEEAADGVQITDLKGKIIYSNKATEKLYGYSPEEFKGMDVGKLNLDPGFADREIIPAIRETGRWAGEVMVKRKDGGSFPVWLTASIVSADSGQPMAMVGIIRDITDIKKLEAEREAIIQELKETILRLKTLSGLLPICAWCKKIRDDSGYWKQVETYVQEHSHAEFTHGICPECAKKLSPEIFKEIEDDERDKEKE